MRLLLTLMLLVILGSSNAQAIFPVFRNSMYTNSLYNSRYLYDSTAPKKWFMSHSISLSAGYNFFKGGNAFFISVPVNIQLNRRISNNLYAYAGVTVAPTYTNFSNAFTNTNVSKANGRNNFYKTGNINTYSGAALGLMYVNDAKTFSISGSIGIERDTYPAYNYNRVQTSGSNNNLPVYK